MAPLQLVALIALVFITSSMFFFSTSSSQIQPQNNEYYGSRRRLLVDEIDDEDQPIIKKKVSGSSSSSKISTKNQTKILKPITGSSKNQTKLIKSATGSSNNHTIKPTNELLKKNKTKLIRPASDFAQKNLTTTIKSQFKKLNSTSKPPKNTTTTSTHLIKKPSDLSKTTPPKNKPTTKVDTKTLLDSNFNSNTNTKKQISNKNPKSENTSSKQILPGWTDKDDDEDDLISGFRYLPSKFQETLLPDLERLSKTSQVYLNKANKEITRNFKPFVGNKYAPTIASLLSFALILIPLILVSFIITRIKAYFSLQKILIFIQIYLSIYFSILCLSSWASGLEPLKFLYATSQSTYVCLQILQTLGYVLYLLLLLMYLVLVFSTDTGLPTKLLSLGQIFVGLAVGLHYYVMVFHRAVLHQPPKTTWRVHAIYATCFLVICVLTRADRRKKSYMEGSGDEGKMR